MPADAYRVGDRFYLHIDLPGVDPDSIDITVEKSTLTVAAERRWERDPDTQVLVSERPYGSFKREFFLGDSLDPDRIEAGYDHGVLTITIPVAETAKARKIEVGTVHEALSH
jgi:HSP20 family protein